MLNQIHDEVNAIFDVLHSIPEKGFEEYKTSAFVAEKLKAYGIPTQTNIGGRTGVLGVIDSGVPGPVVGLRADMDALEYVIDGKVEMRHTCGHDGHTSMLLTAAKLIWEQGLVKRGKLKLIFQPAEEKLYGALSVIDSGVLDDLDYAFGMHVRPVEDMPLGKASPALCHCSCGQFLCKITGKTAHGARPHLGINTVDVAAAVINAINAIRENPNVSHSVKVTYVSVGGDTYNAIPGEVKLAIDMRSQNNEVMNSMIAKMDNIFDHITKAYGADYTFLKRGLVPAAEYDDEAISISDFAIRKAMGEDASVGAILNPGGEDFHHITQRIHCKSAYIGLGAEAYPGLHHQDMRFNRAALDSGVRIWLEIVKKVMG